MKMKTFIKFNLIICFCVTEVLFTGCDKYLNNTQLPANTIAEANVYTSDNSVGAVVTGFYLKMINTGAFGGSASQNLPYITGLYTDELQSLLTGNFADVYYKDAIQASTVSHWTDLYSKIFAVNAAIEGINNTKATLTFKNQWLGESYFTRALLYFYLTNIYGDVPLALSTNYTVNNALSRSPQAAVYQQIVSDLKNAQSMLSDDYRNSYGLTTTDRARPNKAAATALLAKVYLYAKDWADADAQATAVINNSNYSLVPLNSVFVANSNETIWALAIPNGAYVYDYSLYNNGMPSVLPAGRTPSSYSVYVALSSFLVNAFSPNDGRFQTWARPVTNSTGATYYFPNKYPSSTPGSQYYVMLRLADMYLIRAEARAEENLPSAIADLNTIRTRAGLGGTTATTKASFLAAVQDERRFEFFDECANRFFDLKRTGTIDSVMNVVAPLKPTTWQSYMSYWPIPTNDLTQDPNLTPNPGYTQ